MGINNQLVTQPEDFQALLQKAETLVKSGFLPEAIKTPQQAVTIALKGQELGIPAMQSLTEIYVVKGKAQLKSELMLQLAMQRIPGFKHEILQYSADEVVVKLYRHGRAPFQISMTFKRAQESGWTHNKDGNLNTQWKIQPEYMLFNRCISYGLKVYAPDYKFTEFEYDLASLEQAEKTITEVTEPVKYQENECQADKNDGTVYADVPIDEDVRQVHAELMQDSEDSPVGLVYLCEDCSSQGKRTEITKKVYEFSTKKFGYAKCFDCQKEK